MLGMSHVSQPRESISFFSLGERLGKVELAAYLAELDRNIERGAAFAMIVDGSRFAPAHNEPPSRTWQLSRAAAIGKLHRGVAFVTGTMTHDRVRALCALQPPGVPYAFFAQVAEAKDWVEGALEAAPLSRISERKTVPFMAVVESP